MTFVARLGRAWPGQDLGPLAGAAFVWSPKRPDSAGKTKIQHFWITTNFAAAALNTQSMKAPQMLGMPLLRSESGFFCISSIDQHSLMVTKHHCQVMTE